MMKCEYCGSMVTQVIDSRKKWAHNHDNTITRRRVCKVCAKVFTTKEMSDTYYKLLKERSMSLENVSRSIAEILLENDWLRKPKKKPLT